MGLSNAYIQRLFKIMGKVVFYAQQADADSDDYRKLLACTVDQTTSGLSTDADTIVKFATPTITQMNNTKPRGVWGPELVPRLGM